MARTTFGKTSVSKMLLASLLKSRNVAFEVNEAKKFSKMVVPMLVGVQNSDLQLGLEAVQSLEFSDKADFERKMPSIMGTLKVAMVTIVGTESDI